MAEVYGNLVILVMEGVLAGSLTCPPTMHHRHALHDSRRVTDRRWLCATSMATQKSSGNGKDLLQIHVSTTWVGRNHTPVCRYNTCGVTQIGVRGR